MSFCHKLGRMKFDTPVSYRATSCGSLCLHFLKCCFLPENTWNYQNLVVNKTSCLFTSIRDSNIFRACAEILEIPARRCRGGGTFGGLILENPKGIGVTPQIPSMGVVWIFSRTTHYEKIISGNVVWYSADHVPGMLVWSSKSLTLFTINSKIALVFET